MSLARFAAAIVLVAATGAALAQADDVTCVPTSAVIDFGVYDVLAGSPLDGAGSFSVTCRNGRPQDVTVVYIARLVGAPARQLAPPAGGDRLAYNLFVDAARSIPWGDGTSGTFPLVGLVTIPGRGTVTDQPRNFYGRIAPGGQDVSALSPGPPPTIYTQLLTISVTCQPSPPC